MSGEINNTLLNTIYRIEQITPTYIGYNLPDFQSVNDYPDLDQSVLTERKFLVLYDGTAEQEDVSDGMVRVADHGFTVEVYYPNEGKVISFLNEVVSKDQRDIQHSLEIGSGYLGIDSDNTTQNCGIMLRRVVGTKIERTQSHWVLTFSLIVKIMEESL